MESFRVNINTENDAFQPDPRPELAVILRKIADDLTAGFMRGDDDYRWYQTIFDGNGNDVGRYALKPVEA